MDVILKMLDVGHKCFTIVAAGIGIYLFLFKRKTVSKVFRLLLNYSYQITLSELTSKLERLNDLNANDQSHREEIINIFNDIVGQLRGNRKLAAGCSGCFKRLSALAESPDPPGRA